MTPHSYPDNISYSSKLANLESVKKAQGNMMGVGLGIVVILIFIGLLNYINTIAGNIQNRQAELSILESIGMTGRQIRKMLVAEEFLFAGGSLCIAWTAGLSVTYYLYQSMNYRGVPFSLPLHAIATSAFFILLVCAAVPILSYLHMEKKGSVVERIRLPE